MSESVSSQASASRIASALYLSGAITVVMATVLGLVVSPALFGIAVLGIVDFGIARLFGSGRIGPLSGRRAATAAGNAAAVAEADPSFNPYARED